MQAIRVVRIAAFLIDHFIFCIVLLPVYFLLAGHILFDDSTMSTEQFSMLKRKLYLTIGLGVIIYLLKDIVNGRSIGKRLTNISVRDGANGVQVPPAWRLLLRNLTIFIWPVEIIILLLTGKRIGDFIFKTQVVSVQK